MNTESRISVVHVANGLGVGGTQKAMQISIERSNSDWYDLAACAYEEGGRRGEQLERAGYDVTVAGSKSAFESYVASQKPDILHLHGMYDSCVEVVSAARRAGVDVVVQSTPFGRAREEVFDDVDCFLFPSKTALLRYLRLHEIPLDADWDTKFRVLHYPVPVPTSSERQSLRAELNINEDRPVVGKIGRSDAAKWSNLVVDALERIEAAVPDVLLLLVTPPEKIRDEIAKRNLESAVRYLDPIPPDEVSQFYETIDVLAHSSAIGETFGYVIAEAMACETSVVVNSNPMRDNAQIELVDNETTGYVANSTEAYARAVTELLRNDGLRERFGDNAREKVTYSYDPDQIVAELDELYRWYLSKRRLSTVFDHPTLLRQQSALRRFNAEYAARLSDSFGSVTPTYSAERLTWQFVSSVLPTRRHKVWSVLRGAFQSI